MLNHEKETDLLLCLIRAALHPNAEQAVKFTSGCDPQELAAMISRQSLVTMVYPVILQQTDDCWAVIKESLRPVYDREIHKGLMQEYEFQLLLDNMEKDGIDCLPMKGWIMRNYYPDPLMRSMGDLDVLIKDMDSPKMKEWMESRKYILEDSKHPVHDEYQKPPYVFVELHRTLIDINYMLKLQAEWGDKLIKQIWNKQNLVKGTNHIYQLRDEDFYIYHLLHFYKHFMYAGSGIRPLVDIYIFLKKNEKKLDRIYLKQQLKILKLSTFAERMEQLAVVCFNGQALQHGVNVEDVRRVIGYLTGTSTYGDEVTFKLASVVSQGTGSFKSDILSSRIKKCFPPRQILQERYPKLRNYPWMLPFYWLLRAVRVIFLERYKVHEMSEKTSELIKNTESETYNELENIFRLVGITTKSK